MTRLATLALLLCLGTAHAGEREAVEGQVADAFTTGAGLAMGATEANPLGLATLGVKALAARRISEQPAVDQPPLWSAFEALGWGAAANNLCVIAVITTGGGAAVCPVLGFGAGLGFWQADAPARHRATFDAICADARAKNLDLVCIYTTPTTEDQFRRESERVEQKPMQKEIYR